MLDVGIEAEWQVMLGREEFYNVTGSTTRSKAIPTR